MLRTLALGTAALLILSSTASAQAKSATFEARHEISVDVPEGAKSVRIWLVQPQSTAHQKVLESKFTGAKPKVVKDSFGNSLYYIELKAPKAGALTLVNSFLLKRHEILSKDLKKSRPLTAEELAAAKAELGAYEHVVIDDKMRALSAKIVGAEKDPLLASRKIYDWVLENIDYWVKDPDNKSASKVGSSSYCLDSKTGNCTDFHSLMMSLTRAANIPTKIIYGSLFKKELDGKDADQSYHCWLELMIPGHGWIPVDVAVADIYHGKFALTEKNQGLVSKTTADGYAGPDAKRVDYYFGNLDERRVTWSRGRDLVLPGLDGKINAMPKAHVVIDGVVTAYKRKLTFKQR